MPRTPDDPTKAQAWLTQNGPQVGIELYVPRGNKGDPGGITLGTDLSTANLNEINTAGVYRLPTTQTGLLLRNFPRDTDTGVLVVHNRTPDLATSTQTWHSFTNGTATIGTFMRTRNGSVWGPWRFTPVQRVDQTAGRAIYTWDDLNNREQLVYGDTGWRTVTPTPNATITSGTVRYRRVGNQVYLRFVDLLLSSGANGFGELIPAADVPVGFRPASTERSMQNVGQSNNATYPQTISIYSAIAWLYQTIGITPSLTRPASPLQGTVSWVTDEAWPTTLPGTAFGTIPNL